MDESDLALLEFPCDYTLKVLGRAAPDFVEWVAAQVAELGIVCSEVEERPSGKGRFVSVNATFTAESLEQLHLIHQRLRASERVMLML